jgi:D-glycero-D-manno-heptose 1,7-bisphosphate phosphatase
MKKPCLFFDRDGVVNRSPGPGYVLRWEDFHFQDGIFELISLVKSHHWMAILITSQKGVGKGEMFHVELERIHEEMQKRIAAECGSGFDAIYAHTGVPEDPHPAKPDPGMILSAASDHDIDLSRSWMIGDADRDIEMAQRAHLEGSIRVQADKPIGVPATATVPDVAHATAWFRDIIGDSD